MPADVVDGLNAFGMEMFQATLELQGGAAVTSNLVVSPLSLDTALSMLLRGAAGITEREIRDVLHVELADADHHAAMGELLDSLLQARSEQVEIGIANALWPRTGSPLQADFIDTLTSRYAATVDPLDFTTDPAGAIDHINDWAAEHTRGLITKVVGPTEITNQTVMALGNAVFLKAQWRDQFDPEETEPSPFTLLDGTTTNVEMMTALRPAEVVFADDLAAFELPYTGDRLALLVIVPDDLVAFERTLTAERINDIVAGLRPVDEVQIGLPKLTQTTDVELVPVLERLGMNSAFDDERADFTRLRDQGLALTFAKHSTFIQMDEQGTTAAAVTVLGGDDSGPPQLFADRPYLIVLRDTATNTHLFLGRITHPTTAPKS